jgi:hypothetical protein
VSLAVLTAVGLQREPSHHGTRARRVSEGSHRSRQTPRLIIGSMVKVWPAFMTPTALFLA